MDSHTEGYQYSNPQKDEAQRAAKLLAARLQPLLEAKKAYTQTEQYGGFEEVGVNFQRRRLPCFILKVNRDDPATCTYEGTRYPIETEAHLGALVQVLVVRHVRERMATRLAARIKTLAGPGVRVDGDRACFVIPVKSVSHYRKIVKALNGLL